MSRTINKKKQKYQNIPSYDSNNKLFRTRVTEELRKVNSTYDALDYIHPKRIRQTTYTWWDCKPYSPKLL